jgi:branched-chain amino acid transport system permease protein
VGAGRTSEGDAVARSGAKSFRGKAALLSVAAAIALVLAHSVVGAFDLTLLSLGLIYAVAAISLDIVWGYAGIPDLGHAMWFGIGALTVGLSTTSVSSSGLTTAVNGSFANYALGILIGVAVATVIAGLVARFSFFPSAPAGSEFYIAVVTLALTTAASIVYTQVNWTGGESGLYGFQVPGVTPGEWYYIIGAIFLGVSLLAIVLMRSDYGLLLRAVRDNERRIRYLGCGVEGTKANVYMLGAGVSAMAGGLYGLSVGLVSASLFSFLFATQMLVWVAVGGRGTVVGPAIGAIALSFIGSDLNQQFPAQWAMFEGFLFVAVVVFIPDGAFPYFTRGARRAVGWRWPASNRRLVFDPAGGRADSAVSDAPALEIRNLGFSYGSLHVLRGVDLEVRTGELLCIVGPNGAGKSTLMEVITDGRRKRSGSVAFNLAESRHRKTASHDIARAGVIRKFQVPSLFDSLTVAETILLASRRGKRPSIWRRSVDVTVGQSVLEIIEAVGLSGRENALASSLSHGLKQGLEIAAVVAARPVVLILDEPTAGLTANERRVVGEILTRLCAAGMGVVLIEHDLDFVQRVADRVAVLHEGRVVATGTAKEIGESEVVRSAYVGATRNEAGS